MVHKYKQTHHANVEALAAQLAHLRLFVLGPVGLVQPQVFPGMFPYQNELQEVSWHLLLAPHLLRWRLMGEVRQKSNQQHSSNGSHLNTTRLYAKATYLLSLLHGSAERGSQCEKQGILLGPAAASPLADLQQCWQSLHRPVAHRLDCGLHRTPLLSAGGPSSSSSSCGGSGSCGEIAAQQTVI